jgi:predicted membrane channel-forming protein YqfA (hemolysin III family)
MVDLQTSIIDRIDKMEWLDVIEIMKIHKPVEDVDDYFNYVSKWPLFIHLISASICLFLSALYHLFFVYSPEACLLFAKLDYTGIIILFFGSTVPFIQYSFACNEVIGN